MMETNARMDDLNSVLIKACQTKDAKAVGAALAAGANPDATDFPGNPAIFTAIRLQAKSIFKILLQAGANPKVKDRKGRTAIRYMAEMLRDVPLATILIEKGAPLDECDSIENEGCAALHYAVKVPKLDFAGLLLDSGADINVKDRWRGETPLQHLCRSNSGIMNDTEVAAAIWLIGKGADVSARSTTGTTPLHLAAASGNHKVIEAIFAGGAIPELTDLGYTPLHLCVRTTHNDNWIWEKLLEHGNPLEQKNKWGDTPLMAARTNGNTKAVQFLTSKGANT